MNAHPHSVFIDRLGGTAAVAGFFNIKPPSVSEWRGKGIPEDRLIRLAPWLEREGITTRQELFPKSFQDIWPELRDESEEAAA